MNTTMLDMTKTRTNFWKYYDAMEPTLRLGQAFVAFFECRFMPDLFYSYDYHETKKKIIKYMDDWQVPQS